MCSHQRAFTHTQYTCAWYTVFVSTIFFFMLSQQQYKTIGILYIVHTFSNRMHIWPTNIYILQLWYLLYSIAKMLDEFDSIDNSK